MYHITKTRSGKFQVVLVGVNGKVLNVSEEFNHKRSAFANVKAIVKALNKSVWGGFSYYMCAQDDTLINPIVYKVYYSFIEKTGFYPNRRYIPGKNKKKKNR